MNRTKRAGKNLAPEGDWGIALNQFAIYFSSRIHSIKNTVYLLLT